MKREWLGVVATAAKIGIAREKLNLWLRRPGTSAFVRGVGRRRQVDWRGFARWREEELARTGQPTPAMADARVELLALQVDLARLELAARRGESMPVAQHEAVMAALLGTLRDRILGFPMRAAPVVLNIPTVAEAKRRLEPLVDELLGVLGPAADRAAARARAGGADDA